MTKRKSAERRVGEAGRKGESVRSDLHVAVELRRAGGLEIALSSRVEPYYGEDLKRQVVSVLEALGVTAALATVVDRGALPFTVAARVEAAARRAGARGDAFLPEPAAELPPPSAKDRLRRSRLYLPGNEPKFFVNAALHRPDEIILDLEDSVHPAEKEAARILVRNALRAVDFLGAERAVRINQLPLGLEDLAEVIPQAPDMILIPKVETPEQVREVDRAIAAIQAKTGPTRPVWLMPILESALGIENAYAVASASQRVAAVTLGLEDYTADLGVPRSEMGVESWYARTRLVNVAVAAGVQPIDSVFSDVADVEGLRAWARRARALGFVGMGCLHPRQVEPVHRSFAPSGAEIEKALRIVEAFRAAQEKGLAVVSLGSKMIDPPVVERARRLVERARQAGVAPADGSREEPEP